MTTKSPIGWFEIAGPDPAKTEAFYASLFGWTFSDGPSGPDYRMADTGGPMAGGVTKAPPGAPKSYASFGVIVDDIAETCNQLAELGGRVLVGPQAVGDTGLIFANVEDVDGNHFALIHPPAPGVDDPTPGALPEIVYEDIYGTIIDHVDDDYVEIRWYDASTGLTTDTFNQRQQVIADAVDRCRRSYMLIDAVQFAMDPKDMDFEWRDANTIPRFNSAGVVRQAIIVPAGFPPIGAPPAPEGPAEFPSAYFATRAEARAWLNGSSSEPQASGADDE